MVTIDTPISDIYKGTELEWLAPILYYGWDIVNDHRPIGSLYPDIWPNEATVDALNALTEYNKKGILKKINFDKNKPDINVLFLKQPKKSKFAILAAGGGYCSVCTAVEAIPIAIRLYEEGMNVFMLTYSINEACYDGGANEDLYNALKYIVLHNEELNVDTKDYLAGGFSAGGHLISSLLTDNIGPKAHNLPYPKCVFLGYPVISFCLNTHTGSRDRVVGKNPTPEMCDKYSAERHIAKECPKVYLWQCARDNQVPVVNSEVLDKVLTEKGIKHIYHQYDSDVHGWGIAYKKPADGWLDEMIRFYKED